ncbi:DUF4157 domain-containing protein [Desulfobacter curvatus]|uniref:eCIS core domain-containing protein n=1 Tax=Desulfobacter curvatus TaxID=2290 RepID=UPI00037D8C25|nr:DUF4157 domain-containing protein [Desulfobacter curvatus]
MRTLIQKSKATQQTSHIKSKKSSGAFPKQCRDVISILRLQRTIGNQPGLRLLSSATLNSNACSVTNSSTGLAQDSSKIPIQATALNNVQTKLKVNVRGNQYEQEAERISEQVMSMPEPHPQHQATSGLSWRKYRKEHGAKVHLQTVSGQKHDTIEVTVPPIVEEVLSSPGKPLDLRTREFVESRFGYDFSKVRLHTDSPAAKSARALGARAYTVGNNIVFGTNQYMPGTTLGRRLLAHELTHVLQQSDATNLGSFQNTSVLVQRVVSEEERRDAAQRVGELQIEVAGIERMVEWHQESQSEEEELHYSLWAAAVEDMIIALRALARGEEREDGRRYLGQSIAQLVQEAERSVGDAAIGEVAAHESEVDLSHLETALRIQIAHAALAHESEIHRGDADAAAGASIVQAFLTEKLALVRRMIRGDASARRELGSLRGMPGDIIQRWVRAASAGLRERISDRTIEEEVVILQQRVADVQQRLQRLERLLALAEDIFRSAAAEGAALTTCMEGVATLGRAVGAMRNAATAPIWLMAVRVINVRYNIYGGIWAPGQAFALMRENFSRIAQYRELLAQFIETRDDREQNQDVVFLMENGLNGVRDEANAVANEMAAILARLNELGTQGAPE